MPSTRQETLYPASTAPVLDIPAGASANVQIIDSTSRIQVPVSAFMNPPIPGHEYLRAPAFSFLIEQVSSDRKILFDLGLRKDWQNHPPVIVKALNEPGWNCDVKKNVAEILQENGVDVAGGAIEAVVWSHWHFDHTGDVSTFPSSTTLITGAGVRDALLPGFPKHQDSPLLESDFAGREYKEIDFVRESTVKIGHFNCYDYFGDGSFYLLDVPGHAIGHMAGLARVTSSQEGDLQDTFIFMGADTAHHGAAFRPTEYLPLPQEIQPSFLAKYPTGCPGHIFEAIHPSQIGFKPYYQLNEKTPHDRPQAVQSLESMQEFDAADNIFVIIAHDGTLLDPNVGIEWFPHGNLKEWKAKGYGERVRWAFLQDFAQAVESTV